MNSNLKYLNFTQVSRTKPQKEDNCGVKFLKLKVLTFYYVNRIKLGDSNTNKQYRRASLIMCEGGPWLYVQGVRGVKERRRLVSHRVS